MELIIVMWKIKILKIWKFLKIIIILIIFIKDKPVKKQKLEHGKHAAQDQEKENGF